MASISTGEVEWLGVTEIVNKKRQGLYRANATTALLVVTLLIVYVILPWATGQTDSLSFNVSLFFIVLMPIIWCISFWFGYIGLGYSAMMPVYPMTSNTDLSPRWDPRFRVLPQWEKTVAGDLSRGRLTASMWGLTGIIAMPWHDVRIVIPINSQMIELQGRKRVFYLPIGKRKITLHFNAPGDCEMFLEVANRRLNQLPNTP